MSHKTNPLEIPEIVRMIGRYVEKTSEIAAMRVSETFHSQVSATTWETIVVDFTNNALYRDLPSYTGGRPRLLPWKSLESYGSHVRTITMASDRYGRPPASYSRPASHADLLTVIGKLPLLQCMTLDIAGVEGTDLPRLFEICSRLKSLDIRRCQMSLRDISNRMRIIDIYIRNRQMQASAHESDYKFLQELSFSSNCGIDPWEFVSRSRGLRVLSIDSDPGGNHENQMMDVLAGSFRTENSMPSLQHLDLFIRSADNSRISEVLKNVRCLRSFKCERNDSLLSWSFSDFRSHFSTVTTIEVQCGKPEFWQKVMSSFRMLVEVKEVVLFAKDIIGGEVWASTGIESLGVNLFVGRKENVGTSRKNQEEALFGRIANLVKLNHLSVHTGWRSKTLNDQSWGTLLRIKTLKNVELGYELTATNDAERFERRFLEMHVRLSWTRALMPLSPQQAARRDAEEAILLQAFNLFQAANQN